MDIQCKNVIIKIMMMETKKSSVISVALRNTQLSNALRVLRASHLQSALFAKNKAIYQKTVHWRSNIQNKVVVEINNKMIKIIKKIINRTIKEKSMISKTVKFITFYH